MMTEQAKVYPGDLEPIPYSLDCELIYKQRLQDLCKWLDTPYSEPFSLEDARALALCLIKRQGQYWELELSRAIPDLSISELNNLVFKLLGQLPGMRIVAPTNRGRPKGSKKKISGQDLISYSLMERERKLDEYHWGEIEHAAQILNENPQIKIKNRGGSPAASLASQYRETAAEARKEQKKRDAIYQQRCESMPTPAPEMALKIKRCCELVDERNKAKDNGNNERVESLQSELKSAIEEILDSSDGQYFFDLFRLASTDWMLKGEAMRQKLLTE